MKSYGGNRSWTNVQNRREFFDWLGEQLGHKKMDDWYRVTQADIHKFGGKSVLKYYNSSPSKALISLYPEHQWQLGQFKSKPSSLKVFNPNMTRVPPGHWSNRDNHRYSAYTY